MIKKILAGVFTTAMLLVSVTTAAELMVKPLYSDKRFPPTDKLHASCMQNADIILKSEKDIKEIKVIMWFDPEKVDIMRVLPDYKNKEEVVDFTIKDSQIIYQHKKMIYNPWYEIKIFSMLFNSTKDITDTTFTFEKGSYAITTNSGYVDLEWYTTIPFATVPECEPDIIPPSVKLVQPIDNGSGIALDSLFVFEIKDSGKGVDPSSIYVSIGKDVYTVNSMGVAYSGTTLVVQPRSWLPVDSEIDVKVAASDLQVFGWSNTVQKTFTVVTAADVILDNNISPGQLRARSMDIAANQGSVEECILLQNLTMLISSDNQYMIDEISAKMDCSATLSAENIDEHSAAGMYVVKQDTTKLSIFAITWWVLFFLSLILKMHYFVAYRRNQKILKSIDFS